MAVNYVGPIPGALPDWASRDPVNILFNTNVVRIPNGRLDTLHFPIRILLVCNYVYCY